MRSTHSWIIFVFFRSAGDGDAKACALGKCNKVMKIKDPGSRVIYNTTKKRKEEKEKKRRKENNKNKTKQNKTKKGFVRDAIRTATCWEEEAAMLGCKPLALMGTRGEA